MRSLHTLVAVRSRLIGPALSTPNVRHISSLVVTHSRFTPKSNSKLVNVKTRLNLKLAPHSALVIMSPVANNGAAPGCGPDVPPGCRLYWNLTPKDIATRTDALIAKSRAVYDDVGNLSKQPDDVTVDSVLKVNHHWTHGQRTLINFTLVTVIFCLHW